MVLYSICFKRDIITEKAFLVRPATAIRERPSNIKLRPQTAKAADKSTSGLFVKIKLPSKTNLEDSVDKQAADLETKGQHLRAGSASAKGTANGLASKDNAYSLFKSNRVNTEPQKEVLKAEVMLEMEEKAAKYAQKVPGKSLLLKQRKLLMASKLNNLQLVKSSGFYYYENDVNAQDERRNTALYYAARNGSLEFCQYLVDRGARVNERCEHGNTPLHMAFQSDREAVIVITFLLFL